jgi:hypothetical protein
MNVSNQIRTRTAAAYSPQDRPRPALYRGLRWDLQTGKA